MCVLLVAVAVLPQFTGDGVHSFHVWDDHKLGERWRGNRETRPGILSCQPASSASHLLLFFPECPPLAMLSETMT
ncbi:hypothetical protein E1B28_011880 [Marasmius oreades]|uniref:Secreted protein n=1 Tax=Marasmius oreades TaxID=181124 RepID=A0A9P7RV69_9AGAR|nr:uncharacterized protein E1B28_011880 [Marasmius oreades]KAG7090282.1 hypothetical protein E1B28_011880 [Marasmius oreades]